MDLLNENKSHNESTEEITTCEVKGAKEDKLLFDFKNIGTFIHGDKTTNLIEARMLEHYEKGHTVVPDSAKYICFEVPTNIELSELAQNNVFASLDKIGKLQANNYNSYYNIGFINKMENGRYELYEPTIEMKNYVDNKMNVKLQQNEGLFSKRLQDFKKELSEPTQKYMQEMQEKREQRKSSPILEEQFKYKIGDTVYQDYKGTDLIEGKILKINRLNIKMNTPENLLYSAFIEKIDNEEQTETVAIQHKPVGVPVLFTLTSKIEDILKNEDINAKENILQLLSDLPKEDHEKDKIQYIGGIDGEGKIYKDIEICSEKIKNEILRQQEEYKANYKEQYIEEK